MGNKIELLVVAFILAVFAGLAAFCDNQTNQTWPLDNRLFSQAK